MARFIINDGPVWDCKTCGCLVVDEMLEQHTAIHRAHHESRPAENSPFTEPKMDEIQRGSKDRCLCGHERRYHDPAGYCADPNHVGCDCGGFWLDTDFQCPACTCHRRETCDCSVAHAPDCPVTAWLA